MFLVYHVILQGDLIKDFFDFMGRHQGKLPSW